MDKVYKTPSYIRKSVKAYYDRNMNNETFKEKMRTQSKQMYVKNHYEEDTIKFVKNLFSRRRQDKKRKPKKDEEDEEE